MTRFTFLAVLLCMSSGTAIAGDLVAPAAVASDLRSNAPAGGPVQFTWPVDQAADDLDERPGVHVARSTGYAQTVSPADLRRGVQLPIATAGSFLKLSADGGVAGITVRDRGGAGVVVRRVGAASDAALTLDPAAGIGVFVVTGEAKAPVRIDVLERGSEVVLLASADSDVVFLGDEVVVQARLLAGGQAVRGRMTARLLAPEGRVVTVTLARGGDGGYHGRLPALGALGPTGRPWTVEIVADAKVSGRAVRRTTTTAVAISVPTARLLGTGLARRGEDLAAEFRLEVASEGRYAATALLYGRNREGGLQPIAVGQTAEQLAPGRRALALRFDAATISASGLRGPFELRDLRVVDQGRMFVLHRQARGLAAAR